MNFSSLQLFQELPKRLFLEASAGTGKTFSIVHLMCQHILSSAQKGEILPMEEIACITFTRAVSRELFQRLKQTLSSIKQALERKTLLGIPYVDALFQNHRLIPACLRALRQALFDLDLAAIATIHGFSDRLIEGFKEHVGSQAASRWISKSEAKRWFIDCLEHGKVTPFLSLYDWKCVKKYFRSNSDSAIDWFLDTIQSQPREESDESVSTILFDRLREVYRKEFPSLSSEELFSLFARVARSYEGVCDKKGELKEEVKDYLRACSRLVVEESMEPLWTVYGSSYTWKKIFSKRKKREVPLTDAESILWRSFQEHLYSKLFPLIDIDASLQRIGSSFRKLFQTYAQSKGLKTPDFLIESLSSLSEKEDFRSFAQKKYRLIIIDEFQDTDPDQWSILNRLFASSVAWNGSFILVGDPKQSIYSFRKADMYSYLEAKHAFALEEVQFLKVNYRASPKMVQALNLLFSSKEHPLLFFLPKAKNALFVEELISSCERDSDPPVLFRFFEARSKGRWPSYAEEEEELFPWLFAILSEERKRGTAFEKIAILVKDRYQAERVRRAMKQKGIEVLLKRGERITETKAYTWLKAAFSVFLTPKKRQAYGDLCLSVPTKSTLETARLLKGHDDPFFFASFIEEWQKGRSLYEREGIGGLFRHLLHCPLTEKLKVIEWMYSFDEGDEWMLDLEQLVEMLEDKEKKHLCLEELYERLNGLEEEYADDEGLLQRKADPKNHAVSIVTMHSSKGLEFDAVILLGASVRSSSEEETCEAVAEKIRQFYVSVTRAKERCYIPIPLFQENGLSPLEAYFGATFLKEVMPGMSWSQSIASLCSKEKIQERVMDLVTTHPTLFSFSTGIASLDEQISGNEKKREKDESIAAHPVQWLTYSSVKAVLPPPLKEKEKVPSKQSGALWGLRIHRALYEIMRKSSRPQKFEDLPLFFPAWCIEEEEKEPFLREVWSLLTTPLPLGSNTYMPLEISHSSCHVEHAFYTLREESREKREPFFGTFDLVIKQEKKVFVVDWKTNDEASSLSCNGLRSFIEEEGYERQASLYKKAALQLFQPHYEWGGFFFVFSKHRHCSGCRGVVTWN